MIDGVVRPVSAQLVAQLGQIEAELPGADSDWGQRAVTAAMDECLAELANTNLWGRENELPSSVLWNVAGPILARGWMQHRARTKPRGYAGDFELLGRMVRHQLCEDPVGRLFDEYFQKLAAPIAVRNRSAVVRDWVAELVKSSNRPIRVTVVGSGPAYDIEDAVRKLSPDEAARLEVRLLDYDPQALEDAERRIASLLPAGNFRALAGSLFRIPDRPKLANWLEGADLIVSVGMFDYLDRAQSARMLKTFWDLASPGGEVAVFNFSPRNTSRAYMEWIGNWYLLYRDEAEMQQMATDAGLPEELVVHGSEPSGVDLFLRARKPAG